MSPVKREGHGVDAWRLKDYRSTLRASDRAESTQRAYLGDVEAFVAWAGDHEVTRPDEVNVRTLVLRDPVRGQRTIDEMVAGPAADS